MIRQPLSEGKGVTRGGTPVELPRAMFDVGYFPPNTPPPA
jgi:hypothetical protein